jgi:hypothetical protein
MAERAKSSPERKYNDGEAPKNAAPRRLLERKAEPTPGGYKAWLQETELDFHGTVPHADMRIISKNSKLVWHVHRLVLIKSSAAVLNDALDNNVGRDAEFSFDGTYDDDTVTTFLICLYREESISRLRRYIIERFMPDTVAALTSDPEVDELDDEIGKLDAEIRKLGAAAPRELATDKRLAALLQLTRIAFQYGSRRICDTCLRALALCHSGRLTVPIADTVMLVDQTKNTYISEWLAKIPIRGNGNIADYCDDWKSIPTAFWDRVAQHCIPHAGTSDADKKYAGCALFRHLMLAKIPLDGVKMKATMFELIADECIIISERHGTGAHGRGMGGAIFLPDIVNIRQFVETVLQSAHAEAFKTAYMAAVIARLPP